MSHSHRRIHTRKGFTLVELLVVIGVVLVIVSLTFRAMANSMAIARQKATQATIMKIHGLVQQRIEAMNRALDKLNLQPAIDKLKRDLGLAYMANDKVYQILTRKQIFQNRFPQNFYEIDISGATTGSNSASHKRATESSALLYWLLTVSDVYGVAPVDASDFTTSEVADTDGDGLLEFVDAWGHPLRFYRWPTNLFRPGNSTVPPGIASATVPISLTPLDRTYVTVLWDGLPAPPNAQGALDPLIRDPDDPTGELSRFVKNSSTPAAAMTVLVNRFHTPDTYQAFLIMSAGPDNILGVGEPYDYGTGGASPGPDNNNSLISSSPALGSTPPGQGRLASLQDFNPIETNAINDNLTNRKR